MQKSSIQIAEINDTQTLKGAVSGDHLHIHIEYRPLQDIRYDS